MNVERKWLKVEPREDFDENGAKATMLVPHSFYKIELFPRKIKIQEGKKGWGYLYLVKGRARDTLWKPFMVRTPFQGAHCIFCVGHWGLRNSERSPFGRPFRSIALNWENKLLFDCYVKNSSGGEQCLQSLPTTTVNHESDFNCKTREILQRYWSQIGIY